MKIISIIFGIFTMNATVLAAGIPDKIIDGIVGNAKSQEILEIFNDPSKSTSSMKTYSILGYKTQSEFSYENSEMAVENSKMTINIDLSSSGFPFREFITFNSENPYLSCVSSYSQENKLIESTFYSRFGVFTSKTLYLYDKNSKLIQEINTGIMNEIVTTNVYDLRGMLSKRFLFTIDSRGDFISLIDSYKSDGLRFSQITEVKIGNRSIKDTLTHEYSEPDGKGNFFKRTIFKTDKAGNTTIHSKAQIKTVYYE